MGDARGGTLDIFRNLFGTLSGGLSIFTNNPFQRKYPREDHVDSIAKQFEASALVDGPVKAKSLDADAKVEKDHASRSKRDRGSDLPSEIVSKNFEPKKRRREKSKRKLADGGDIDHTAVVTTKEAGTLHNGTMDEKAAGHQTEEDVAELGVIESNHQYGHVEAAITRHGKKKSNRNVSTETDLNQSETPRKKKNIAVPKTVGDAPQLSNAWSAVEIEKDTEEMNVRRESRLKHDAEGDLPKKRKKKERKKHGDDHTEKGTVDKDSITSAEDVPRYKRKLVEVETREMNGYLKDGPFLGGKAKDKTQAGERAGTGSRKKSKNTELGSLQEHVKCERMQQLEARRKIRKALGNLQVDDEKQKLDSPVHKKRKLGLENPGFKRKREDDIEERYEKRLKSSDEASVKQGFSLGDSKENKARKYDAGEEETHSAPSKKRKLIESRKEESATNRAFDDEEKLRRTVFVGNLPVQLRKKAIIKEFSQYGSVESVRLRSVPLLETKMPRRGAIIKGQINEAVGSKHAYVVFKEEDSAKASLAHNMKELLGNHIRVDAARAPCKVSKEGLSMAYDRAKSIFVGNLPFDVKDEELYQLFGTGPNPEIGVEAVRVVRDPQTSLSKGIAFVLFKNKVGASQALSKRIVKLRNRILRISRVLPTQTEQRSTPKSGKRQRERVAEEGGLRSKRAKLLQPYEGTRATKVDGRPGKWTASSSNKDRFKPANNGVQPGRTKSPAAAIKKGYQAEGNQNYAGVKRKRTEKRQRGISRAKKIRRA